MSNEESRTDLGTIRIHKNVIASIAITAALETEGVKRVGRDFISASAVKVEFDKNDEVKVRIPVIIKYGYNIPAVAGKLQENIRAALEKMTDLSVKDIDINVQAIENASTSLSTSTRSTLSERSESKGGLP